MDDGEVAVPQVVQTVVRGQTVTVDRGSGDNVALKDPQEGLLVAAVNRVEYKPVCRALDGAKHPDLDSLFAVATVVLHLHAEQRLVDLHLVTLQHNRTRVIAGLVDELVEEVAGEVRPVHGCLLIVHSGLLRTTLQ